jgi:fibronectin-binding autotransporter adhesin
MRKASRRLRFQGRGRGLLLGVGLLAALILVAVPAPRSWAATIQVTTTADLYDVGNPGGCGAVLPGDLPGGGDGQISLREALCAVNNTAGPDTITFAAGTDGTPIVLAGTVGEDANVGGDLDILAAGGNLTVRGNGAGQTIIDGDLRDRVFHVCPGGACTIRVTFEALAIRRGMSGSTGGGLWVHGGQATVDGCQISGNQGAYGAGIYNEDTLTVRNGSVVGGAGQAAVSGGGIYNVADGQVTVDASRVEANTAWAAGGIYNAGTLHIQNGSVVGGEGVGNAVHLSDGGGIYNDAGGTATVDASTVSANTAADHGGGIYNAGVLTIQNGSTVGGAGQTALSGGGIYNAAGGQVTVDASTIGANTAGAGGGVYNAGTLDVENGSVVGGDGAGNEAETSAGGGIYNAAGGTATVDASTVSANTAAEEGGGIYNEATLTVRNGSTVGGEAVGNRADQGGGIANAAGGTATVTGSVVGGNWATERGGGIYNEGTLTVQNGSTVGGAGGRNQADIGGGICNAAGGTATVAASTVRANRADAVGGGIYNDATLVIENGSTVGGAGGRNQAGTGGGLYNEIGGTATVDASAVSANQALEDGGGIYNGGTLTVERGSVVGGAGAGNHTLLSNAGGIYNAGSTTIDASTVSANTAAEQGGGIYNAALGTATVTGSRLLNNEATEGGGLYNNRDAAGATSVTDSCIVGNSDIAFFNQRGAEQTATRNWWGAATGPNTPGADTVSDNVDTSGFRPAPILGCTPDLQVSKANDVGGRTSPGRTFAWTLSISNMGDTPAVFGSGDAILEDELPAGPAYGAPVAGNFEEVTNQANVDCRLTADTLTCVAGGDGVTIGASGGFDVVVSVTPDEMGTLRNPAGICRVDPDGQVPEGNEGNNNCPADTVEVSGLAVYLPLVVR